ncbi:MAG: DUF951 domain-containing protein [Clostridia bacterium]|nr:DUF951 domain-containing protein [Clostridia bacterium]
MLPLKFNVGDVLLMKKKHPCSSDLFKVARLGSDVRIICQGCGRDLTLQRDSLEKMIKRVQPKDADA